jgi:hypothetical protein
MAIDRNHTAEYMNVAPSEVKIVDGVAVKYMDVLVHTFSLGDVEDPDIYAAEPIWAWQQTPAGCWVMEHAVEKPYWVRRPDYQIYGYEFKIIARLSEADAVFFKLKYVGTKN